MTREALTSKISGQENIKHYKEEYQKKAKTHHQNFMTAI